MWNKSKEKWNWFFYRTELVSLYNKSLIKVKKEEEEENQIKKEYDKSIISKNIYKSKNNYQIDI